MSFNVQRSERKTEFWKDNTPKVVAPGTYNTVSGADNIPNFRKEHSAPFNSVKERDVHDRITNYPGPGFYQTSYTTNEVRVSSANQSNSFATKVSRFAPTAPGSTVFKTATSFFNPGPGTYYK